MSQKVNSKTSIKCKLSNELHKILEPNMNVKGSQRWRFKKKYTDQEKIELFDKIKQLHDEISIEYTNCLFKNRMKKKVLKLREEKNKVNS